MAGAIKTEWFGKQVRVLMINGKTVTGELSEITDHYALLNVGKNQILIMVHAIIAVQPAGQEGVQT